jgi:hypothetical protein
VEHIKPDIFLSKDMSVLIIWNILSLYLGHLISMPEHFSPGPKCYKNIFFAKISFHG